MKRCNTCGGVKPAADYTLKRANKDGLETTCRDCMNAKKRAKRKMAYADLEKKRANKRRKYSQHPDLTPEERKNVFRHHTKRTIEAALGPERFGEAERERAERERYWIEQERAKYPKARIARPLSQQIA